MIRGLVSIFVNLFVTNGRLVEPTSAYSVICELPLADRFALCVEPVLPANSYRSALSH